MKEILPGIFHWRTLHEGIGEYVHSYFIEAISPAVLVDPRVPAKGLQWFDGHQRPAHSYLTNRHHYRHSAQFEQRFGTRVWCHQAGLHEYTRGEQVTGFEHGDRLPGGVMALKVAGLTPEETAFHFHVAGGVMAIGDAIVRDARGHLSFVPDPLMGDNPEQVKRELRQAFEGHLRRKFDHLLLAHGRPQVGDAKRMLAEFLQRVEP